MRKKRHVCSVRDCDEPPHLGGYCKEHHAERSAQAELRDAAVRALHTGAVGERLPADGELREELQRLRAWWDRACSAINYQRRDPVLLDEAEYAAEWCIRLAQEIVIAEQAIAIGQKPTYSLEHVRTWVWERFANLEAGLKSNGVKRQ